jgi:hypothetical protein
MDQAELDDLQAALDNPDYQPDITASLVAMQVPERVLVGRQFQINWRTNDCVRVVLLVPGQAPRELPAQGGVHLRADVCGPFEIELELWSYTDLDAGYAGCTERFAVQVEPRPLSLMVTLPPRNLSIGATGSVSWVVRNARRVELRHCGQRTPLQSSGTLDFIMPAFADLLQIVAYDEAGRAHVRDIALTPPPSAQQRPLQPLPVAPLRGSL